MCLGKFCFRVSVIIFGLALPVALSALFVAASASLAEDGPRVLGSGTLQDPPVIQVVSNRQDGVDLEFQLPVLALEDLSVAGETFQSLGIPFGGERGEVGEPLLPVFSRMLQVPEGAEVRVEATVTQADEYGGIKIIPVQGEADQPFAYNSLAYSRNDYGDVPAASIGEPARMRGLRIVPLTFAPVQYNPAQGRIRVARRIEVRVSFAGGSGGPSDDRPIPSSFDRMYRNLVDNYESGGREAVQGTWLVICANNSTVISSLQPLVNWRQRKGLKTVLATTAETGTTTASIKNYLQNAYNTWDPPLEYVVLAGDASGTYAIPTWHDPYYGGEGDHPYTQLDGTDILADVHIGRLSFSDTGNLQNIVSKIVNYESNPFTAMDPDWYNRACLVGDPNQSGYSTVQVMQCIKTRLRQIGYTQIDTVFSGSFVAQMITALNRGDTIFAYRGYYQMSGWSNGNTDALTNGWKMPFVVISTCGTGDFESSTARSEGFLRAWDSTNSRPRGAVGAIGTATIYTNTRANNCYTFGVMASLLYEGEYEMGVSHTRGKLNLYLNYWAAGQSQLVTKFSYWNNLMGDPACQVWTGYPELVSVVAPTSLAVGANSVLVTASEEGNPSAGAQVCLWKGSETYIVGRTDTAGQVELPVSLVTSGDLLLTVTKHNRRAYLGTIPVSVQPRFLAYQTLSVDDDNIPPSQGNGDAQVNPTETIETPVQIKNLGTEALSGITGVLSSSDPYVTVLNDTTSFANLPPGASTWSASAFAFAVAPGCPHGHVLRFGLDTYSAGDHWHSLIEVPAVSADLRYKEHHWYNAGPNGLLDPGETVQVSIALNNLGGLGAETPSATLVTLGQYVDVPVPTASYPTIAAGSSGENIVAPFTVHAASDCFRGYVAHLMLLLQFSGGIQDTVMVSLPVGTRTSADPSGPDDYGYLAYDDTDLSYPSHPTYSWIEIDPSLGGSGVEVVLGDNGDYQDKTRTVTLPFPFGYYGASYTTASICSNGWIVMGQTYITDYRNWTLPSVGGPNGVIAIFWDDIYQAGSNAKCWQKYDSDNHKWVVEWSRFTNNYNYSSTETFQAIFYDPVYYPTATGDGIIDFQYKTFANVDGVDGFCTVGLENPENTDGLLYTYFNQYTPGSAVIGNNRAIRFVPTREVNPAGLTELAVVPDRALVLLAPNPMRPGSAVRFSLDRPAQSNLGVYDVQGRLWRRLADGVLPAGWHEVRWDGRDDAGRPAPSGIYFYRLRAGDRSATRRGMLIR